MGAFPVCPHSLGTGSFFQDFTNSRCSDILSLKAYQAGASSAIAGNRLVGNIAGWIFLTLYGPYCVHMHSFCLWQNRFLGVGSTNFAIVFRQDL